MKASAILSVLFAVSVSAAERMNVLLIISDDMRTELGCYASTLAKTPNLDKLAATGVRFERAYCQFPLCGPSRSSMLTGRHPGTTGVLGNRTWFGDEHPEFVSLPKHFKNNGYTSIRVGKIFHGGIDDTEAWSRGRPGAHPRGRARGTARGRSRREARPTGQRPEKPKAPRSRRTSARTAGWCWRAMARPTAITAPPTVRSGISANTRTSRSSSAAVSSSRTARRKRRSGSMTCGTCRRFRCRRISLRARPCRRGFPPARIRPQNADLFVGRDASPDEARQMIRAYLASSSWMDWNVGRVLAELDRLGLREKTIVVFWGDHGYQLGEKGKWSKAGSLWEQGARTPFLICDPREKTAGKVCPRVVQMVDLYPTLVELCGLEVPPGLEGLSLAPLVRNPDAPWDHPAYTVWSEDSRHFTGVMVRTEKWRYARVFRPGRGRDVDRSRCRSP